MNKNKLNKAVVTGLLMWMVAQVSAQASGADTKLKIDRVPPVTGGGDFISDVSPEPVKPNVFVIYDNSYSMAWEFDEAKPVIIDGETFGTTKYRGPIMAAGVINGLKQLEGKIRLGYTTLANYYSYGRASGDQKNATLAYQLNGTSKQFNEPKNKTLTALVPRDFSGDFAQEFYGWIAWSAPTGWTPVSAAFHRVLSALIYNSNPTSTSKKRPSESRDQKPALSPTGKPLDFFADTVKNINSEDYGYPLASNKVQSCRANFLLIFADGGYDDEPSKGKYLSIRGVNGEVIEGENNLANRKLELPETIQGESEYDPQDPRYGYIYRGTKPFYWNVYRNNHPTITTKGGQAVSDYALYGWIRDLRPDLKNDVAPYWHEKDAKGNPIARHDGYDNAAIPPVWDRKNDPATWQHLTTFSIGLADGVPRWTKLRNKYNPNYPRLKDDQDSVEGYYLARENDKSMTDEEKDPLILNKYGNGVQDAINGFYFEDAEQDFAKAAMMGRGEALMVSDAESFERVLDRISTRIGEAYDATLPLKNTISAAVSTTAITSTQETDAMLYSATVNVQDHTGDVLGYKLCARDCKGQLTEGEPWNAADKLYNILKKDSYTGYKDVKIYTLNSAGEVKDFRWDSLDTTQKAKLKSSSGDDAIGKGRVDYIRGKFVRSDADTVGDVADTTETDNTLDPTIYRARGHIDNSDNPNFIGEVVYSQPHYVDNHGTLSRYHPARNSTGYTKNFLKESVEGRKPIVLFGSNDGKVYALNGENGEVIFQYVPLGAYDKLAATTQPGFKGDTLVAGQFEVKDVQFNDGSWHTLAVGSMGAGGKSVFAFDLNKENLNDPEKFIKWEQTADSELGQTLGNVIAKPRIVWLADKSSSNKGDGKWVVLVPNGYNNDANSASLIVFDAENGQVMAEIDTKAQAAEGSFNGLGPLTVQDYDFDGGADFVYAGDLQGNVWKFDLTGWKDNEIDLAYQTQSSARISRLKAYAAANKAYRAALQSGDSTAIAAALQAKQDAYAAIPAAEPFFVAMDAAGQRQPITSEISIADSVDGEGAMLYVGTGSLFSTDDALKARPQSFYAVYENYRYLTDNTIRAQLDLPLDRNDLFAKKVVTLSSPNSDSDAERGEWMQNYGQLRGIVDAGTTNNDGNSAFTRDSYQSYNKSGVKIGSGDKLGWFIDFPEESYTVYSDSGEEIPKNGILERVLNKPIVSDNELYFLSFSPRQGAQVEKQPSCGGGEIKVIKGGESGITRFYMLDRMTGNYLDEAPFDLSGDGVTDKADMITVDSSSTTSTTPTKAAAGIQFTGGYATLAGAITTVKKTEKQYIDNAQFKSSDTLCETERQIIFPSATDKDGKPLVLRGCYENRFKVWKQIQQEF